MPREQSIHAAGRGESRGQQCARPSAAKRGYDKHWKRLRLAHLSAHPLCVDCLAQGISTAASDVDHIRKFKKNDGGIDDALRLDPANLQSLCHSHHSMKTNRNDRPDRAASKVKGCTADGTPIDEAHPWST